jgi:hypothetical protein
MRNHQSDLRVHPFEGGAGMIAAEEILDPFHERYIHPLSEKFKLHNEVSETEGHRVQLFQRVIACEAADNG